MERGKGQISWRITNQSGRLNGQQRFEYDRVRGTRNESNYQAAAEIDSQRSLPHSIDLSITGAVPAAAAAAASDAACANFAGPIRSGPVWASIFVWLSVWIPGMPRNMLSPAFYHRGMSRVISAD